LEVDLAQVKGSGPGGRIVVEDVKAFATQPTPTGQTIAPASNDKSPRILASPKARRVAQELGVALAGLTGTGVDGLITARDVEAAADSATPQPSAAGVQPLSKLRQTIARRMQTSKQTAPHFYLTAETDMTQAQQLRAYCRQTLGWERSPTYTDLIVRACVVALVAMPDCNITYTEAGLAPRPTIDIGVAVSVAGGLIVPVLPGADRLSLAETSAQIRDLGERARQGRLRPADMGAKSMVVSNLGMTGVDSFTAIIDPPDPMILAVGRVAERIVPLNGQPVIRPMCTLTLSADHRAFDGVQGAQFLMRVKAILENPFEIMAGK
jgi:pyruvate dehydrogenase E2 component (dihydrolipoamide acetyltransferase)